MVVVTELCRKSLLQRLQAQGVDCAAVIEQRGYIPFDITKTLSTFMVNGLPNRAPFSKVLAYLIVERLKRRRDRILTL